MIGDETGPYMGAREPERPWWQQPWFLASAAVLAVIAMLGVWTITRSSDVPEGQGATVTAPANGGADPTAAAPAVESAGLTAPPKDVNWNLWYGIALPSSPAAGPKNADTASGYSHDAAGALLAAVNIQYRSLFGANWRTVLERQVVASPAREQLLKIRTQSGNNTDTSGVNQVAAFKFITYTPEAAVIELVLRTKTGSPQASSHTVRWVDGDWRLDYGTDPRGGNHTIASLNGYVQWAGVAT